MHNITKYQNKYFIIVIAADIGMWQIFPKAFMATL